MTPHANKLLIQAAVSLYYNAVLMGLFFQIYEFLWVHKTRDE